MRQPIAFAQESRYTTGDATFMSDRIPLPVAGGGGAEFPGPAICVYAVE
jgi:hypothetical protein